MIQSFTVEKKNFVEWIDISQDYKSIEKKEIEILVEVVQWGDKIIGVESSGFNSLRKNDSEN